MIASAHYLRRHVSRRPWSVVRVFRFPNSSHTEVSDSQVTFFVKDDVLGFQVSMYDAFIVEKLETKDDTTRKKF